MPRLLKGRILCPIRIEEKTYMKGKLSLVEDHLSFQKVVEVLYSEYVKGNKNIKAILAPYANQKYDRKRKDLSQLEIDEIRELLETEISPVREKSAITLAAEAMLNEK